MKTNFSFNNKLAYATTALVAAAVSFPANSFADVVDGTFTLGSGTFTQSANNTTIDIDAGSSTSIIEFNEYNIGAGQSVNYNYGGAGTANSLNQVTGANPSTILGSITSNNVNVWLINPNGVFFGNSAVINVPSLIVTTSSISQADFVNGVATGVFNFTGTGNPGATIQNDGKIKVADAGIAALVAPNVINNGTINAKLGTVALAGGEVFTLDFFGDNLINFTTTSTAGNSVENNGVIKALKGSVQVSVQQAVSVIDNVINMNGVVEANEVTISGDNIVLGSSSSIKAKGAGASVTISGTNIDAQEGSETTSADSINVTSDGGFITVTGLLDSPNVSLSAINGGVINLDEEIQTGNLTGSSDTVNVLSNDGIINQAITLANNNANINLGADTFYQSINIDKKINLNGQGVGLTIIDGSLLGNAALIEVTANKATINDLEVVDGSGMGKGIFVNNANGVEINNVDVHGFKNGIYADSAKNLTVDSSNIHDNNLNGIYLTHSNGANILNSSISGNGNSGVNAQNSNSLFIDPTFIFGNTTGVTLVNSINAVIQDSFIFNNTLDGVVAQNADNLTITNTEVTDNGANGVILNGSDNSTITNSIISSNGAKGMRVVNSDSLILDNVSITDNKQQGMTIKSSDNVSITNSDISFNGKAGIYAAKSNGLFISDTTFANNKRVGVRLSNSDGATIENSTFSNNNQGGVYITNDSDGTVITNTEIFGSDKGIHILKGSDLTSITSVNVHDNDTGVQISDSDNTTIDNSTIANNDLGVYAFNGFEGLTIQNSTLTGDANTDYSLLVNGNGGALDVNLTNVVFNGTEDNATILFEDATDVSGVDVAGVQLLSTAPVAWQFNNVSGSPVSDTIELGDMNFNDTVFNNTYSLAYIELINSTMDGDASNSTFIGTPGPVDESNAALAAMIIDDGQNPALGTILFPGSSGLNLGNLANEIANRTDIVQVYYNAVSTVGKVYDTPSLKSAEVKTFNPTNDFKVSLNGTTATLNAIAPAAGASASDLSNIEPSAGGNATGGAQADCGTNFANNFLGDNVSLANATGGCQL